MDHTHLLPHHLPTRTTTHLRSSLFTGLNFSYNLFNPVFSDRGLRPLLLLVGGVMWSRHTCNEIQGQRLTDGKGGVYRIASSAIFSSLNCTSRKKLCKLYGGFTRLGGMCPAHRTEILCFFFKVMAVCGYFDLF